MGGVRGAQPAVALEQARGAVEQEREEQALGLGEIEGTLEGAPGGARVAERVAGDRLEQERLNVPEVGVRQGNRAVNDRGELGRRRGRIALGEPEDRRGIAHLPAVALRSVQLGEGLFDALRVAQPDERLQQCARSRRARVCSVTSSPASRSAARNAVSAASGRPLTSSSSPRA